MSITEERKEKVNFTTGYMTDGARFAVLENSGLANLEVAGMSKVDLSNSLWSNDLSLILTFGAVSIVLLYSLILVITPAPTVLPPSLIENLSPSSIATGTIKSTSIVVLSPGITISTPSPNSIDPVTSVVLK